MQQSNQRVLIAVYIIHERRENLCKIIHVCHDPSVKNDATKRKLLRRMNVDLASRQNWNKRH